MIKNCHDADTGSVWKRQFVKGLPHEIQPKMYQKLGMLHAAGTLDALRVPPGNRLESLGGDREGQHSIRINDQWRICFVWKEGDAYRVEITDYH